MDEEVISVDVTVQTPEPSLETPLQEEPKTLDFLVGQLTEKISTLETNQLSLENRLQIQQEEMQILRELDRMNSEEVYRIANEVMGQVEDLKTQVAEVIEEEQEIETSELDNIPVIPSQDQAVSTDSEQEQPKPAKKRHWWL